MNRDGDFLSSGLEGLDHIDAVYRYVPGYARNGVTTVISEEEFNKHLHNYLILKTFPKFKCSKCSKCQTRNFPSLNPLLIRIEDRFHKLQVAIIYIVWSRSGFYKKLCGPH